MEFKRSRSSSKLANHASNNPYNKYQIGQMIGEGQFGKVYKAYLKNCAYSSHIRESTYAVKIIPLGKFKKNPKLKQLLANEIKILTTLRHENIIKFQQLFTYQEKIYMVYEYCQGGDLEQMLPLSQNKALEIFTKIIKACSFAEKHNILHRDLKPANILFKNGEPRVADWGFSRFLKEQLAATSFVGSPAYMAPELLNDSQYTNKVDVWSFGIMVYESLYNEMPWPARNIKDLLYKMKKVPLKFPEQTLPTLKNIIKLCLEIDPEKRVSFQKLERIIQFVSKTMRTKQVQNPQQKLENTQLSQSQIRKCSYYLEFAKKSQKFQDTQTISLCLDLILSNLHKIKVKNFGEDSQIKCLSPCLSQRKISSKKKELTSPKTWSKIMIKQESQIAPETYALLNKEISLIQKIKFSFNPTSLQTNNKNLKQQKILIKQIIKKLIKNLNISQKPDAEKTNRKQLIEMNCILQTIMFEELCQEVKNKRLSQKMKQMQQMSVNSLIRSVNHKILYVNQHYCKN